MLAVTPKKKLNLILQTIQSKDEMLIRSAMFNLFKLIENDEETITAYCQLSPNLIELFDDSIYQIMIQNIHLSSLWIKLILLILQKLTKTSQKLSIIDKLLDSSSKHKMIIINLKNNKQIDSENIVLDLINEIGTVSNQSLQLLISALSMDDHGVWHSFWSRCKHHALSDKVSFKLSQHLLENICQFAVIIISSNDSKIISTMTQNKPFWNLIKSLMQKQPKPILFDIILQYFTSNNCKQNALFLEFWLFALFDIRNKSQLFKLFSIAANIPNIYRHLTTFLLKISIDPHYIELLITFFKQSHNAPCIMNFIQKRTWHIADNDKYFDEISLLNDLYKIMEQKQVKVTNQCIPLSLTSSVIKDKLIHDNIIVSFSVIHLLYWFISHGITHIIPSIDVLMNIYRYPHHSDTNAITIHKYQTLLTQLITKCLSANIFECNECYVLWNIVIEAKCDDDTLMQCIAALNKKCVLWNNDNYIHILHTFIHLMMRNPCMIDLMIDSVLPSHHKGLKWEMRIFLHCICLEKVHRDEWIAFAVVLLSQIKFDVVYYKQIKNKFHRYPLFIYVLYVLSVANIANYQNSAWFTTLYRIYDEWFMFNDPLRPQNNLKQIEEWFKSKFKLKSKLKLKWNDSSLSSLNIVLNDSFERKYYFNNVYSMFIDICKHKENINERMLCIVDECCGYFHNICRYLTMDELTKLIPIVSLINTQKGHTLYFKILSSILKSVYIHHYVNTSLIQSIKDILNIKQLIRKESYYDINGVLYYLNHTQIMNIMNRLMDDNEDSDDKLTMFMEYMCNVVTLNDKYIATFVDKLCPNPSKCLNDAYWSLCCKVIQNKDKTKDFITILNSLMTILNIEWIINDNKQNISIILEILSCISECPQLKHEHINIFIIVLKTQDYNFLNKAFLDFLIKYVLNLNLNLDHILLFILRLNGKIKVNQNDEIKRTYLDTVYLCFKHPSTKINKEILRKLDTILFNDVILNVEGFWKFLCDLCIIQPTKNDIKHHISDFLNKKKIKRRYHGILSKREQVSSKQWIIKMINIFEIKLNQDTLYKLFFEYNGFSNLYNHELLTLMKWNQAENVLLSKYSHSHSRSHSINNDIISWFNHLDAHSLKRGTKETNDDFYDIEFIWISMREIIGNMDCNDREYIVVLVKKIISSQLIDYILMGMTNNDLSLRQKCYGLFQVFYQFLDFIKNKSATYYKWYFIVESLRLSIKEKYEILSNQFIDFIIYSIHISPNPLHSEYSMICDSFCTKTMINKKQLPLQHRILLTHFVDIEKHEKEMMNHIQFMQTGNKYINNRIIACTKLREMGTT